jgi:hypothetical protein
LSQRSYARQVVRSHRQHKHLVDPLQAAHHHLANTAHRFGPTKALLDELSLLLLENASHVRNAVAHFNQAEGVIDAERDAAWKRIRAVAKKFTVELHESEWREIDSKKS